MTEVLTFRDVFEEDEQKSILLGNGFSIELFGRRFSYDLLKQEAINEKVVHETALHAFNNLATSDFERVLRAASRAVAGLEIFSPAYTDQMEELLYVASELRKGLCYIVSKLHPDTPDWLTDDDWNRAVIFLLLFENIFTTNYDLGIYWLIQKANKYCRRELKETEPRFVDGFGLNLLDETSGLWGYHKHSQNVHFLHGALHLFFGKGGITKLHSNATNPIGDQIRDRINEDNYPIFIAEGKWQEKLSRIVDEGNPYLGHCYTQLTKLSGALFTFGASLTNDIHLLQAIKQSKRATKMYVGVFDPADATEKRREKIENEAGIPVTFFDSRSIKLKKTKKKSAS